MAYTGYGRRGDIGQFGLLGEWTGPEIANSIFSSTPTDFGNTKIKTRKCADGSLPPCDEDVTRCADGSLPPCDNGSGCIYGKCPDGSCKDSAGNCEEIPTEDCKYGKYANGTC